MSSPGLSNSEPQRPPGRSRAGGFTLVEVMVALIIIAIGTLGIAKMQALALSSTGASRSRALAAIEASSLAAAMHANRGYWASSSSVPGTITVTTTSGATPTVVSTSSTMQTALSSVKSTQCNTVATMEATLSCYCASGNSAPCSSTYVNMAASDMFDWGMGLGSLLPNATATVTCTTTDTPVDCTIALNWIENAVALTTQETSAAKANANTTASNTAAFQYVTYTLYVVP
jgi:type IV pilus assembly protein PilV